jgi:uncharacterized protein
MVRMYKKIIMGTIEFCSRAVKTFFHIPTGCCRFYPSCTEFAKEAIEKLPPFIAIGVILIRICRCHPFSLGGFDPVIKQNGLWKHGSNHE